VGDTRAPRSPRRATQPRDFLDLTHRSLNRILFEGLTVSPKQAAYLETVPEYGGAPCKDCGGKNHPYMLTFALWLDLVGLEDRRALVCLPCIEKRMREKHGRSLELKDFLDVNGLGMPVPINYGGFGFHVDEYLALKQPLKSMWELFKKP
jgi:hypothetical protein